MEDRDAMSLVEIENGRATDGGHEMACSNPQLERETWITTKSALRRTKRKEKKKKKKSEKKSESSMETQLSIPSR